MNQWMGVDIGDAAIKAAMFDPTRGEIWVLEPAGAGQILQSSIGFVPQQTGGVRTSKAVFPFDENLIANELNTLAFSMLKRTLLPLREYHEIECLMAPVLQHLRSQAAYGEVGLSLVVPSEYPAVLCNTLTELALRAGFTKCWYVHELTAAVLACLPRWRTDARRWAALEAGQPVWVLDCGSIDMNIGLVKVERSGDAISIRHLAGSQLAGCGSIDDDPQVMERFSGDFSAALMELLSALEADIDPAKAWAIVCGGGSAEKAALGLLNGEARPMENFAAPLAPVQVLAAGAAVHAAMMSGAGGLEFGTIEARKVLGIQLEQDAEVRFEAFRSSGLTPPYTFEGAYRFESGDRPLEVTLAAALPGGDRSASIESFVLGEEELSRLSFAGILVRGHLDTWKSGRVGVYDLGRGEKLRESNFRLP